MQVMTDGIHKTHEKYGRDVRISHAKAHALLEGSLSFAVISRVLYGFDLKLTHSSTMDDTTQPRSRPSLCRPCP